MNDSDKIKSLVEKHEAMKKAEAWGTLFGSLVVGALFVLALRWAFAFTWPQSFVLTWLYCLLRDSIQGQRVK